jgi:2-keto-4-pentenoate hydratase
VLARAHARSGDRHAIAGYLGSADRFDRAVAAFAEAYARVNDDDHRAFAQAVADGKLTAVEGV